MKKLEPRVIKALPMPTILEVPHEGKMIRFAHPRSFCFDNSWLDEDIGALQYPNDNRVYLNEKGRIIRKKLRQSTPEEFISLIYLLRMDKKAKQGAFEILGRGDSIYLFNNTTLWAQEGVYMINGHIRDKFVRDLTHGTAPCYIRGELSTCSIISSEPVQKRLAEDPNQYSVDGVLISGDREVAFAPKGTYKTGEHTVESFAKDGLVIALARGKEGAYKLAEILQAIKKESSPEYWRAPTIQDNPEPQDNQAWQGYWRDQESSLKLANYSREPTLGFYKSWDSNSGLSSPAVICD